MPEVAEVRLIADNLDQFLTNRYLTQFRIKDPVVLAKWVNRNCPGLSDFNKKLDSMENGLLVKSVHTRGKFCYIQCDKDIYIGISFGMSGNIRPEPTPEFLTVYKWKGSSVTKEEYLKHCHISIEFTSLEPVTNCRVQERIYYHDIRRFGRFDIFYSRAELDRKLAKLGHDPLSEDSLDNTTIVAKFRKYNSQNICRVLMEQELFAGVGNFIKSETLYEAKISPHAIVSNIPDKTLLTLYEAIKKIAKDDYESGGCALYTYSGLKGDQSDFKETLKVYGNEGKLDSNGYIIKRIPEALSPDKRSTFWVPEIQIIGIANDNSAPTNFVTVRKKICLPPPKILPIFRPPLKITTKVVNAVCPSDTFVDHWVEKSQSLN